MILYGYWRSSCTWRARIALAFKGIDYRMKSVHLLRNGGEQHAAPHHQRNPLAQVPVLQTDDGRFLSQSMAILEYLEESHPTPALLPRDPWARAQVRQVAEMINSGIQPLQNLAVLQHLREGLEPAHKPSPVQSCWRAEWQQICRPDPTNWARHFIETGLDAVEAAAQPNTRFLVADRPSYAEVCLIPQMYNARRFDCDLARWPRLLETEAACRTVPAFQTTHPALQPDAVKAA